MSSLASHPHPSTRRTRWWRVVVMLGLASVLVATTLAANPSADGAKPKGKKKSLKQVSLVSFVGGSTNTLTISWPKVKKATKYEIDLDDNYAMTSPSTRRISATGASRMRYTITGLAAGRTYCVQVRGKKGKTYGKRSRRTCKPTVIARGPASGPAYRVMTYNVCAQACKGKKGAAPWSRRSALATRMVLSNSPDVVALQEHPRGAMSPLLTSTLSGTYAATAYASAKELLYKRSRFTLADSGSLTLSRDKFAVWAELIDRAASNRRVIFVSAHLSTGKSAASDTVRGVETSRLISGIEQINQRDVPVVFAGDFNSNKSRPNDAPRAAFNAKGYYDAYDLAAGLIRPNWNSAANFSSAPSPPRTSYKWGDHVDHVWVRPGSAYVAGWTSPAVMKSSNRYAHPMPSDHKPVVVSMWLN